MTLTEDLLFVATGLREWPKPAVTCDVCKRKFTMSHFLALEATNGIEAPVEGLYWRQCECNNALAVRVDK